MKSQSLSEYEEKIFSHIDSMKMHQWYTIKQDRPDRKEFIEALDKYQETWHMLEVRGDYHAFRKVWHPRTLDWAKRNNVTL